MKILEPDIRIINKNKNNRHQCETHDNYENLRNPHENHENQINRKQQRANHKIVKKHRSPKESYKN